MGSLPCEFSYLSRLVTIPPIGAKARLGRERARERGKERKEGEKLGMATIISIGSNWLNSDETGLKAERDPPFMHPRGHMSRVLHLINYLSQEV